MSKSTRVARHDGGAGAGLALLDGLDRHLPRTHTLAATRGELLHRLGRSRESVIEFDRAIELVATDAERAHLVARRVAAADP